MSVLRLRSKMKINLDTPTKWGMLEGMSKSLADTLKLWRERKSLTQVEAANLLGVTLKTLQAWEQEYRKPKPITARAVLQIIGA